MKRPGGEAGARGPPWGRGQSDHVDSFVPRGWCWAGERETLAMLKRIAAGLILAVAMVSGVAAGQIEDADAA